MTLDPACPIVQAPMAGGATTPALVCAVCEAGIPEAHKQAILAARENQTRITRAFSGRPARGLVNAFMDEIDAAGAALPYPLQNALTRPMRAEAARQNDASRLSLWAGQGVRLARTLPAAELVATLRREYQAARSAE